MNTLFFKYAVEVAKAGSITQAAQNLYMAQPNLSKAIRDLEEDLGYTVFHRTSGGVKVTEKGGEFLYHAHKMLEQLDEMEKIAGRSEENSLRFKISIPRGSYIANGFAEFVAELDMPEGMQITINETNVIHTIDDVVNHSYNMGIIRYRKYYEEYFNNYLKNNNLNYEMIWEFEYVLLMSSSHPLAQKENITSDDLVEYIEISHGDMEVPHAEFANKHIKEVPVKRGKTIYVYERGSQFDILTNVHNAYMWVSPLPLKHLNQHQLVQRACQVPDHIYRDVLIYRKDYQLGENDKLFQKKLYESKVEVSSSKYE